MISVEEVHNIINQNLYENYQSHINKCLQLFKTLEEIIVTKIPCNIAIHSAYAPNSDMYKFSNYGVLRRFDIMVKCMQNVYSLRNPTLTDIPTEDIRSKLDIQLQCFYFNLYGAYENLAMMSAIAISKVTLNDKEKKNASFFNYNFLKKLPDNIKELFSVPQNLNIKDGYLLLPDPHPGIKHGYKEYFDDFLRPLRNSLAHQEPLYVSGISPIKGQEEYFKYCQNAVTSSADYYMSIKSTNMTKMKDIQIEQINRFKNNLKSISTFKPLFGTPMLSRNFYSQPIIDIEVLFKISVEILNWIIPEEIKKLPSN